jgi:hypothetical protein
MLILPLLFSSIGRRIGEDDGVLVSPLVSAPSLMSDTGAENCRILGSLTASSDALA